MELADFFLTASQAAKKLGVTRVTIWRWGKEGRINGQHIGREMLIPKWEVDVISETKDKKI